MTVTPSKFRPGVKYEKIGGAAILRGKIGAIFSRSTVHSPAGFAERCPAL